MPGLFILIFMDKFLNQFSKTTQATVAIIAGMIFLTMIYDPPRSVCDTQMEKIKESQKLFLYKAKTKKGVRATHMCYRERSKLIALPSHAKECIENSDCRSNEQCIDKKCRQAEEEYECTKYQSLADRCKRSNNPGGCYELFSGIKTLLTDLESLTRECGSSAGNNPEVKAAIKDTLELIVRLAWGEKPPASYHAKFSWLDAADISLFCKLRNRYQAMSGDEAWKSFRQRLLTELPGAKELPQNEVWDLSIFSENCARYP